MGKLDQLASSPQPDDLEPRQEANDQGSAATRIDLSGLAKVAEGVAPGPWTHFKGTRLDCIHDAGRREILHWSGFDASRLPSHKQRRRLAHYIATFDPPAVLQLLAEIARLRLIESAARKVQFSAYPAHGSGFICQATHIGDLQAALGNDPLGEKVGRAPPSTPDAELGPGSAFQSLSKDPK